MCNKEVNIFFIIPARIGSKRLKEKNIFPVLGKPMIRWTIDAAKKSKYYNSNIYVSGDSEKISNLCKDVEFINRPKELAGDEIWTQDVVNHFIKVKRIENKDIIVILQANSPEINHQIIDLCIEKLIKESLWQVHTVDENMINNGAIHAYLAAVKNHAGKVNYNGVVKTNWIDVHYKEDVNKVEEKILNQKYQKR